MIFRWETEEELALKKMKISPAKKLEWLGQMNEFLDKYTPRRSREIRKNLYKDH